MAQARTRYAPTSTPATAQNVNGVIVGDTLIQLSLRRARCLVTVSHSAWGRTYLFRSRCLLSRWLVLNNAALTGGRNRGNLVKDDDFNKYIRFDHAAATVPDYTTRATNNPTPQPAGEGGAPEPCGVCSFHWNQIVMSGEVHNRNCPHYDDRDKGCACQRCGTRYKVDVIIADSLWMEIHGKDTLLCGNCIVTAIENRGEFDYYDLVRGDARTTQPATAPSETVI